VVSKVRTQRIGDRIREELSEILIKETSDPRLAGVSITDVTVDRELDYANIYFSAVEGSTRAPKIMEGFRHAQGFLRSELARRIELRSFPRLRFHWDPTFENADHMEKLFAALHDQGNPATPEPGQVDEADKPDEEAADD
jgi:ribosome-binding factor A